MTLYVSIIKREIVKYIYDSFINFYNYSLANYGVSIMAIISILDIINPILNLVTLYLYYINGKS